MRFIFFRKYLFIFVYLLVAALPTFPIYQKRAKYFCIILSKIILLQNYS